MFRKRSPSTWLILLALVGGLGLVLARSFQQHGVPPKILAALMRSRSGNTLAQGWLRVTAPAPPTGVTVIGIGQPLPAWNLPDTEGHMQALSQWHGKKLLINFWATWCAPCRKEMPALAAAQQRHGNDGVQIIGIAMDSPTAIGAFLHAHPQVYPILLGSTMYPDPRATLGNTRLALPYSVLVNRDGRIIRSQLGPLGKARLQRWLR